MKNILQKVLAKLPGKNNFKIGTRVIKTGIAVTITMLICEKLHLEPAVFGAVSAVINMQPSVYLTFKTAREQIIIHVLGVVVGLALGLLTGGNPLTMGVATILIIMIYTRLKLANGILMGIVAAVFILGASADEFMAHALGRSAVIFVGLVVAMTVNVVLWPPRHRDAFFNKVRECNLAAVNYFCQAVHDFVHLDNSEIPVPVALRDTAMKLSRECRVIAGHYLRERNNYGHVYGLEDSGGFLAEEKFLDYNDAIIDKASQIYDLLPARLERRLNSGAVPVSVNFRSILNILESGCITIQRVNGKLTRVICDSREVAPEEISEDYWEQLRDAIEKWKPGLIGSFYLHALIEVAVVAGEIRWVAREGKKLINMAVKNGLAS